MKTSWIAMALLGTASLFTTTAFAKTAKVIRTPSAAAAETESESNGGGSSSMKLDQWELSGATNASINFQSQGDLAGSTGNNSVLIFINGTAGVFVTPNLEPRFSLTTAVQTGETSLTTVRPMIGLVYNFSSTDIHNSFYAGAEIGPQFNIYSSSNSTVFAYGLFVGKRMELTKQISWVPEFSFTGHTSSTSAANQVASHRTWSVIPFQISLFL